MAPSPRSDKGGDGGQGGGEAGSLEAAVARAIADDEGTPKVDGRRRRLSLSELRRDYGSCTGFMLCHGLEPWNKSDWKEARLISEARKALLGLESPKQRWS